MISTGMLLEFSVRAWDMIMLNEEFGEVIQISNTFLGMSIAKLIKSVDMNIQLQSEIALRNSIIVHKTYPLKKLSKKLKMLSRSGIIT